MGPQSAYDAWSGRCIRLVYGQCFVAAAYLGALILFNLDREKRAIDSRQPIPTSKIIAAICPGLFPFASLLSRQDGYLRLFRVSLNRRINPLVFAVFQAINLITCIALTVCDAVTYRNAPLFWLSLILYFFPAVIGFGHAVFGVHLCYSRKEPYIKLISQYEIEPYTDLVEEDDGPLARAYRLQKEERRIPDEDGSSIAPQDAVSPSHGSKSELPDVSHSSWVLAPMTKFW